MMHARAFFPRPAWWRLASCLAMAATFAAGATVRAAADEEVRVDLELVLAVDISYSMDEEEQALQRQGYIEALTSKEFLDAVKTGGPTGKVAVAYVEWAGWNDQRTVMDWQLLDGPGSAQAIGDLLRQAPTRRAFRTSISGAIRYSAPLFDGNGFRGLRRVIDISGDGVNNQGDLVTTVRDEAVAKGIVINGLPLMLKRPTSSRWDVAELDVYYEDCVIGGAGAFVLPVREREQFADAIRRKLVLEVAGLRPPPRAMLRDAGTPRVLYASSEAPRIDCGIGERLWRERMRN